MKPQKPWLVRYVLMFLLGLVIIRFLPVVVRLGQSLVMGARAYWWLVVPVIVMVGVVWRMRRQKLLKRSPENLFNVHPLRDVTNSALDKEKKT